VLHRRLNLGILAHVDAGKTTLTERLLYAAGVIGEVGSVDAGTTQTDSLALERQRGITIKAAVASFPVADVTVNLIDTPGHPDFIAEVERALSVLDGAVLVLSAVEGVQPQTRILMRALQRLAVPTILFVNKIDRSGADEDRVLEAIARRMSPATVPMGTADGVGTRAARFLPWAEDDPGFRTRLIEVLAARNDALLATYVENESGLTAGRLRAELATQTGRAQVHPVYFGSAITGAGVEELTTGLVELLPAVAGDVDGPVSGQVFKIERGPTGEKIAYARMFSGAVRVRERIRFGRTADAGADSTSEAKVTAINAFDRDGWVQRQSVAAGEIGKLWGLGGIQVGDAIGQPATKIRHHFAPPTLETVVVPVHGVERAALRAALTQLAEQDPLINVRQDDTRQEISVSLYGEVQKEVIGATLASEFGVDVTFRETTTICVERPSGSGEAVELLNAPSNPFRATIGLRVEPAPADSGIEFRLDVDYRTVPLYVFKTMEIFGDVMEQTVKRTLHEGLFGWQVTDCVVTMVECNYSSPDGPPSTNGPLSTPADYRRLTPLVLMLALERAGTQVCEPVERLDLELPAGALGGTLATLGRLAAQVEGQFVQEGLAFVRALLPVARLPDLQRQLPGLTGGEGVLEAGFAGYQPVAGPPSRRPRTTADPLNRAEYLMELSRLGMKG
jgi:ribosomal protection tetracycline resistance protein